MEPDLCSCFSLFSANHQQGQTSAAQDPLPAPDGQTQKSEYDLVRHYIIILMKLMRIIH